VTARHAKAAARWKSAAATLADSGKEMANDLNVYEACVQNIADATSVGVILWPVTLRNAFNGANCSARRELVMPSTWTKVSSKPRDTERSVVQRRGPGRWRRGPEGDVLLEGCLSRIGTPVGDLSGRASPRGCVALNHRERARRCIEGWWART
jgi:hypothetical protein